MNKHSNTVQVDEDLSKKLKEELADERRLVACAKEFGIVGDATRLKICYLLCHHPELSVSEIAQVLGTSVSLVSHSLRRLREVNLVKRRRQAQTIYYSLKNTLLSRVLRTYLKVI